MRTSRTEAVRSIVQRRYEIVNHLLHITAKICTQHVQGWYGGGSIAVGERLRELREARGLTEEELGERLSVRGPTISRYELGKSQIRANDLPRIAAALGVSPRDFFADSGALPPAVAAIPRALAEALERYGDPAERMRQLVESDWGLDPDATAIVVSLAAWLRQRQSA